MDACQLAFVLGSQQSILGSPGCQAGGRSETWWQLQQLMANKLTVNRVVAVDEFVRFLVLGSTGSPTSSGPWKNRSAVPLWHVGMPYWPSLPGCIGRNMVRHLYVNVLGQSWPGLMISGQRFFKPA
jgi:hypothetical protein